MADFGKLNFSVALDPTSAFPLDARCYFESLALAKVEAAAAAEVGNTNTKYYIGQRLLVREGGVGDPVWYTIQANGTLLADGATISDEQIANAVENYISENPITGIVVDAELSEKSTNPVQNKVVTAKVTEINNIVGNIDVLLTSI